MTKTYATGKDIYTTSNIDEIMQLYASSLDESNARRAETKFLFCWNYNRLEDNAKDEVCKRIKKRMY